MAGCACLGILGAGPPDVSVYDIPERPALRAVPFQDSASGTVSPGTIIYTLRDGSEQELTLAAAYGERAWPAFQAWLRELLARFNANRCALLAVNGTTDPRCEPPR